MCCDQALKLSTSSDNECCCTEECQEANYICLLKSSATKQLTSNILTWGRSKVLGSSTIGSGRPGVNCQGISWSYVVHHSCLTYCASTMSKVMILPACPSSVHACCRAHTPA